MEIVTENVMGSKIVMPALVTASTPYRVEGFKDVDGRDEPGHDVFCAFL